MEALIHSLLLALHNIALVGCAAAPANPSGGSSPYAYLWSNGSTTAQISNLTAQIYIVTVTDANGCNEIDSVQVPLYVGIKSQISNLTSQISIFPNPNNGEFDIAIYSIHSGEYSLEIKNMLGEVVFQSTIHNPRSKINLEGFSCGVYTVQLISEIEIISRKIILVGTYGKEF